MSEYPGSPIELVVTPGREVTNEIHCPDEYVRAHSVIALTVSDAAFAEGSNAVIDCEDDHEFERKRDVFRKRYEKQNSPITFSIRLRSDREKELHAIETNENGVLDFNFDYTSPFSMDRRNDLEEWIKINMEEDATDILLDFCSGYHPYWTTLEEPQRIQLMERYFGAIKNRIVKGGILVLQLDQPYAADVQERFAILKYNTTIVDFLKNFGFSVVAEQPYKKDDGTVIGTHGTVYIFQQNDHVLGEKDPHTDTSESLPSGSEQEAVSAVEEMLRRTLPV